jgi:hypothetical protein
MVVSAKGSLKLLVSSAILFQNATEKQLNLITIKINQMVIDS